MNRKRGCKLKPKERKGILNKLKILKKLGLAGETLKTRIKKISQDENISVATLNGHWKNLKKLEKLVYAPGSITRNEFINSKEGRIFLELERVFSLKFSRYMKLIKEANLSFIEAPKIGTIRKISDEMLRDHIHLLFDSTKKITVKNARKTPQIRDATKKQLIRWDEMTIAIHALELRWSKNINETARTKKNRRGRPEVIKYSGKLLIAVQRKEISPMVGFMILPADADDQIKAESALKLILKMNLDIKKIRLVTKSFRSKTIPTIAAFDIINEVFENRFTLELDEPSRDLGFFHIPAKFAERSSIGIALSLFVDRKHLEINAPPQIIAIESKSNPSHATS